MQLFHPESLALLILTEPTVLGVLAMIWCCGWYLAGLVSKLVW